MVSLLTSLAGHHRNFGPVFTHMHLYLVTHQFGGTENSNSFLTEANKNADVVGNKTGTSH